MSELEKRGVATVAWTAKGFVEDAHWSANVYGCPEAPIAEVPYPFTNQDPGRIHAMVDAALPQIIAALTHKQELLGRLPSVKHVTLATEPELVYTAGDLLACFDEMQTAFIRAGWSDGMPLVPPTRAKVEAMIAASGRKGDEVVGLFEPGFGIGTVEKIAANAVMAGCKPATMPIILAMMECILEPRIGLRGFAMSTGPQAPVVMVSGPMAQEIGMNHGVCALGPGSISQVNVSIGRALRLIMMNVGHSYPGVSDMDTIGSAMKFSACVAENEAANPWEPYRVSKGYDRSATTVTVNVPYGVCELFDFQNHDPELLVESFCSAIKNGAQTGSGNWLISSPDATGPMHGERQNLILLCPDHATVFRNAGWSLQRLKEALYNGSRMSFRSLMLAKPRQAFEVANPHMQWLWDYPETEISMFRNSEDFDIFVVGADAGRSLYHFGGTLSISRQVKRPR
ncbi:MAG: hypothetical protein FJ039_08375 [Chloroflexi bacterium]|nr:hypothetical protein [Chloroflexota bacterium]